MKVPLPNKRMDDFQSIAKQAGAASNNYHFQFLAHCYFLSSGLWLWCRWALRRLLSLGTRNVLEERTGLVRRFHTYLDLLKSWGIIELEFVGFEDLASWQGSVIAPNHPSILDVMFLMTRIPSLDCVMNNKLLSNPITSGGARLCDFIQNDSLLRMVKTCKERLITGANILIFPEGTRTTHPPLGSFHHSYALAAKCSGAPIRTVIIECNSEYFGRRFSYFKPARCPIRFRITEGKIFHTSPSSCTRSLSSEVEDYFRSVLGKN